MLPHSISINPEVPHAIYFMLLASVNTEPEEPHAVDFMLPNSARNVRATSR